MKRPTPEGGASDLVGAEQALLDAEAIDVTGRIVIVLFAEFWLWGFEG